MGDEVARPVYRDGRLHVLSERCATCILRPDGSIRSSLHPGRVRELVRANLDADAAPACHHTTYGQDPQGEAICRGFYDLYRNRVTGLRLAEPLGVLVEQTLQERP